MNDLTSEEIEISIKLHEASEEIEQLDGLIDHAKRSMGRAPALTFPGEKRVTPEMQLQKIKQYQLQKQQKILLVKEESAKLLEKKPVNVQSRCYKAIDDWAEEKQGRKMTVAERAATKKDLSASQELAMLKLTENKDKLAKQQMIELLKKTQEKQPGHDPNFEPFP